jgi:RNA polymerase sigma factor (TIGR02999 family)
LTKPREITRLLQLASDGDSLASESLFSSVYQELRVIARAHRRRWNGNHTLNTTALIHEAYLKLAGGDLADYRSRTHFFATASKAMRQVLMNYAERVSAAKRGGAPLRVTLSGHMPITEDTVDDLLVMNSVLEDLERTNARHCRLFECRVFGGMTIQETASALDVSPATVKRDWALLSAWVFREMSEPREA